MSPFDRNTVLTQPFLLTVTMPESVVSDPRFIDPLRRLNRRSFDRQVAIARTAVRTGAAESLWTTLWTWLATIAAAVVILGLAFGYGRSDPVRGPSGEPIMTGSAAASSPSGPVSVLQFGYTGALR
jgi:hypothetical protein